MAALGSLAAAELKSAGSMADILSGDRPKYTSLADACQKSGDMAQKAWDDWETEKLAEQAAAAEAGANEDDGPSLSSAMGGGAGITPEAQRAMFFGLAALAIVIPVRILLDSKLRNQILSNMSAPPPKKSPAKAPNAAAPAAPASAWETGGAASSPKDDPVKSEEACPSEPKKQK